MPTTEIVSSVAVPARDSARKWLLRQYVFLALSALLLLRVFEGSDLDRQLPRIFFSSDLGNFPLRRMWFLEAVMHKAAKQATYVLVAGALYLCWEGWKGRLNWLPPRNALLAAVGMVAIPGPLTSSCQPPTLTDAIVIAAVYAEIMRRILRARMSFTAQSAVNNAAVHHKDGEESPWGHWSWVWRRPRRVHVSFFAK